MKRLASESQKDSRDTVKGIYIAKGRGNQVSSSNRPAGPPTSQEMPVETGQDRHTTHSENESSFFMIQNVSLQTQFYISLRPIDMALNCDNEINIMRFNLESR